MKVVPSILYIIIIYTSVYVRASELLITDTCLLSLWGQLSAAMRTA